MTEHKEWCSRPLRAWAGTAQCSTAGGFLRCIWAMLWGTSTSSFQDISNQCFLFLQGYILIFVTFINSAGGGMDKRRKSSTKEKFGSLVPVWADSDSYGFTFLYWCKSYFFFFKVRLSPFPSNIPEFTVFSLSVVLAWHGFLTSDTRFVLMY